jgi:hypothetical protein
MAVGDVKADLQSVTNGNYLEIRPVAGEEWVIHNIYYSGQVQLYRHNGTSSIQFDTDSSSGARLGAVFHCTNGQFLRVINNAGATINIAYDGVQTK